MRMVAIGLTILAAAGPLAAAEPEGTVFKKLPGIVVDTKGREVRLEGTVCRQDGALELLVCSEGTREHESVIVVKARPSHVTFALALLGLEPGQPGYTTEGGGFSPPAGQVLDILARFRVKEETDEGEETVVREVPAHKLLALGNSSAGARPIDWVYVGRPSRRALAAADHEGTVVCLSNFVEAVIDVPFESTDVDANLLYEANRETIPPEGTPAEVVIRPRQRRIRPKKVEIEVLLEKGKPARLDGKEMTLGELEEAVRTAPAEIRTAVLRADADEAFGRVMKVSGILRDALMRVTMKVRGEEKAPTPGPVPPPVDVLIRADDTVTFQGKRWAIEEFRNEAAKVFEGVERIQLRPAKDTSWKTVALVLEAARDAGVVATVSRESPGS